MHSRVAEYRHTIRIHYHGTAETPVPMLFENSKPETPETLTHLHSRLDRRDLACIHFCKPETLAAEVFQGGANKVKFLVVDN